MPSVRPRKWARTPERAPVTRYTLRSRVTLAPWHSLCITSLFSGPGMRYTLTMPGRGAFSDSGVAPDARGAHARTNAMRAVGETLEYTPLPGNTARELAGPLALKAMRAAELALNVLEAGTRDRDERVAHMAARWLVQAAPRVAALSPPDAAPAATAEERDAALRAALESAEFCELLVRVVAVHGAEARLALIRAGWTAPEVG